MSEAQQMATEQQKLEDLVRRYSNEGYRVVREPRGEQLPSFLRNFTPDLIVQKGAESIVVEVKRRLSVHDQDYWKAVSEAVANESGWKLQIVLMDLDDIEWTPPATLPNSTELRSKLKEVNALERSGQSGPALLLLWSVFEAAARHHLAKRGVAPTQRFSSMAVLKQLLSEGIIDDEDYERLVASLADRNVVAHGFFQQRLSDRSLSDVAELTNRLTDQLQGEHAA